MITNPATIRHALAEAEREAADGKVKFLGWTWVDAQGRRIPASGAGWPTPPDSLQVQIAKRGGILTLGVPANDTELLAHLRTQGIG